MRQFTLLSLWCFMLVVVFPREGISLKMIRVSVPQYTLKGDNVELFCQFDLEGDRLYSVSWYKDHDEFYRYVPRGNPSKHIYRIDGIKVDHASSDEQKVVIRNIPLKSSGMYRCEVSAEAPAFSSVHGESRMDVVALPKEGPEIVGEQKNYKVGEDINLNCTSARSFPPARLQWYVNDEPVTGDYEAVVHQHGLMTTIAGLRFRVGAEHFHQGRLQVRCLATISNSTPGVTPPPAAAPVLHPPENSRIPVSSGSSILDYNKEALFSVKGNSNKDSGDVILVTVTSLVWLCT